MKAFHAACAALLCAIVVSVSQASVWLSSYSFAPNNLPTIYSDDTLYSQYKLRAKINGAQYANDWNNNGWLIDSAPSPGTYTVTLYYLQYDSTGSTLQTIGPMVNQTLTVLQPVNGVAWNGIYMPSTGLPGSTITFNASVTNTGNTLWDSNYYLELKDWNGTHLYYPSLATTAPGGSISPTFSLTLPSTAGTYTYYFTALQNGVQYFGPTQSATIVVDTPPVTSLSVSSTSITLGQSVTLTSTTTDADGNLTSQAIDYIPPGGSGWVSGTATNGNRWDGGPTGSNPLTNTMTLSTGGTWQFRARGGDNLGELSNFQYVNVTVNYPPSTTISASTGSTTVNGNTSSNNSPLLSVPSGQSFTITSVTSDADWDLTTQQFDLSTDGGSTWSLGNSGNSRLWSGSATNSNTLAKTFVLQDGTFLFRARGEDAAGAYSTYQYVNVRVGNAPSFTTQPASQTVTAGSSVTFTVASSGSTPISYQWQKNGTNISGATSASYTISSAQSGDAATYTCYASNFVGAATSNGATLTVNQLYPPTISSGTANGVTSTAFSYQISATNATTYGASGLPAGLSVNTSNGVISGTPTVAGNFAIALTASNAGGTATGTLTLTITFSSTDLTTNNFQYDNINQLNQDPAGHYTRDAEGNTQGTGP